MTDLNEHILNAARKGEPVWRRPLSTTQVADALALSDDTIRNWIEEGRIPARRLGRNFQIPRAVVEVLNSAGTEQLSAL